MNDAIINIVSILLSMWTFICRFQDRMALSIASSANSTALAKDSEHPSSPRDVYCIVKFG